MHIDMNNILKIKKLINPFLTLPTKPNHFKFVVVLLYIFHNIVVNGKNVSMDLELLEEHFKCFQILNIKHIILKNISSLLIVFY